MTGVIETQNKKRKRYYEKSKHSVQTNTGITHPGATRLLRVPARESSASAPPPPDGGYPGQNTAEGQKALFNLTTGAGNTAIGWYSLFSNADGSFNTATGAGALLFNTADENTAFGTATLLSNTTGF